MSLINVSLMQLFVFFLWFKKIFYAFDYVVSSYIFSIRFVKGFDFILLIRIFFVIIKGVLATYAKFDDVIRDKSGVLFIGNCTYVRFNYAINVYVFVNTLVILHLIKTLTSTISINIDILLLHWYSLWSLKKRCSVIRYIFCF